MRKRATEWVRRKVPYDQRSYRTESNGVAYRQDCSGYISMIWQLERSFNTETLCDVTRRIERDELRFGDIVMFGGPGTTGAMGDGHVVLFDGWTSAAMTSYLAFEQHGPDGAPTDHREIPYPYLTRHHRAYLPYRYRGLDS
jgi:hypothetical protein